MQKYLPLALCFFIVCQVFFGQQPSLNATPAQPVVSLRAEDKNLKEVVDSLSKESGYEIILEPRWYAIPVTMTLVNQPLDKALVLLLGTSTNYVISWKESEKQIYIYMRERPPKREESSKTKDAQKEDIIDAGTENIPTTRNPFFEKEKAEGPSSDEKNRVYQKSSESKKNTIRKPFKKWTFKVGRPPSMNDSQADADVGK